MNQSGSSPVLRSTFSTSGVRRFDSSAEADSYGAKRRHSEEESSWWRTRVPNAADSTLVGPLGESHSEVAGPNVIRSP